MIDQFDFLDLAPASYSCKDGASVREAVVELTDRYLDGVGGGA